VEIDKVVFTTSSIQLPHCVCEKNVKSRLENGVLSVMLRKLKSNLSNWNENKGSMQVNEFNNLNKHQLN